MRFIRRLRDDRGMTLIELMVAATICAVGTMATIGVIDNSRSVAVKSEKREAMAHQAQREVERLMELPFATLAHPAANPPVNSPTPGSPASYVNGNEFAYDRNNPGTTEQLVTSVNGQVGAPSVPWNDAQTRLSGQVHRFVTRIDPNARRVTVVVTANGMNSPRDVLMSSIKTKPIL